MSVWTNVKQALGRFIPSHVNDPFGLVRRMLCSGKKAAPFTLLLTGISILAIPFDWLMQRFETSTRSKQNKQQTGPHIIVCGPARSGTTLVYQVLANSLDVTYVKNFTVAFSRSPVLASRLFTRRSANRSEQQFENYYGKTAGMQSPCEANHLWNQWVDADASDFRTVLGPEGAEAMTDFFTSFSASEGKPTLSKNNNANAFAEALSQSLDNVFFICMKRDTRYLAQSLLQARLEINGDIDQSYGVTSTVSASESLSDSDLNSNSIVQNETLDPVTQVLEQIDYLNKLAIEQQTKIGEDRFWVVGYEEFCNDPGQLIERVNTEILKNAEPARQVPVPTLKHNNICTSPDIFRKIESAIERKEAQ